MTGRRFGDGTIVIPPDKRLSESSRRSFGPSRKENEEFRKVEPSSLSFSFLSSASASASASSLSPLLNETATLFPVLFPVNTVVLSPPTNEALITYLGLPSYHIACRNGPPQRRAVFQCEHRLPPSCRARRRLRRSDERDRRNDTEAVRQTRA